MRDAATTPVAPPHVPVPDARQGAPWLRRVARVAAASVVGAAVLVLVGYVTGSRRLIGLGQPGFAMSPLTALALVCLAAGVLASARERSARGWAAVAAALAGAVLASTAFLDGDRLSPAMARWFGVVERAPATMSQSTALCVLLLAAAAWWSRDEPARPHGRVRMLDVAAGGCLVLSGLGVLGYAYGARHLFDATPFHAMALPTALCLFVLSLATVAARPGGGWAAAIGSALPGGSVTRRQLLFTLVPPTIGWLLVGAMDRGDIEANSAMALLVAMTIVPLAALVLRDGATLDLLDLERRNAAAAQVLSTQLLEARLAAQAERLDRESGERLLVEAAMHRTQRLEAVGQLTGGIAHDFNNLLMAVRGNLELVQRKLPPDSPARRFLEHALAAAAKGTKVTQQLLAFSRTQRLEVRPVDVGARLQNAFGLIEQALGAETTVRLEAAAAPAAPLWAHADPDQLELAVLNAAINSRDAMPAGGTIRLAQRVEAASDPDADDAGAAGASAVEWVVVSVADDGEGMAPEILGKATEPFFTTKAQGRGTGLGLAQAYGFAKQCGGDLRIASAPGRGTTVEIWLRRAAVPQDSRAPSPTLPAVERRTNAQRRVVLIDDDDAVRLAVAEALRQGGHTVTEAANGIDGLARLTDVRPDVAIVDFLMPGLNGADVARRAQRDQPDLPVVFISGFSDTLALDGIAHSVVLRKPFELDALLRSMDEVTA